MKKKILYLVGVILFVGLVFRLTCGIFIIQPIGAIPKGITIIYWKANIDLNIPFIASVDGVLDKSGNGVSLLGRGILLGKIGKPIKENEIFSFGYSERLYLISTEGKKFEK